MSLTFENQWITLGEDVLSFSRSEESKGGQTQSSQSNSSGLPFLRFNVNCDFLIIC